MKLLTSQVNKIRAILAGRRGESLMEGIVSVLVFTLLAAAVSMMIITSIRMTSVATREAGIRQGAFNSAMNRKAVLSTGNIITFTVGGEPVSVTVTIYDGDYDDDGNGDGIYTAFAP